MSRNHPGDDVATVVPSADRPTPGPAPAPPRLATQRLDLTAERLDALLGAFDQGQAGVTFGERFGPILAVLRATFAANGGAAAILEVRGRRPVDKDGLSLALGLEPAAFRTYIRRHLARDRHYDRIVAADGLPICASGAHVGPAPGGAQYVQFHARHGLEHTLRWALRLPDELTLVVLLHRGVDGEPFGDGEYLLASTLTRSLASLGRVTVAVEAVRAERARGRRVGPVLLLDGQGTLQALDLTAAALVQALDDATRRNLVEAALRARAVGTGVLDVTTRTGLALHARVLSASRDYPGHVLLSLTHAPHCDDVHAALQAEGLSPRESQVAVFVSEGLTNDRIAERLGSSASYVRRCLESIGRKTGARSRVWVSALVCEMRSTTHHDSLASVRWSNDH